MYYEYTSKVNLLQETFWAPFLKKKDKKPTATQGPWEVIGNAFIKVLTESDFHLCLNPFFGGLDLSIKKNLGSKKASLLVTEWKLRLKTDMPIFSS